MKKLHAAGWAPDAPTPAQLKELFGQIDSGKVTKDSLQAFLRGETVRMATILVKAEQMAAGILGVDRVFGYQDTMRAWGIEIPEIAPCMSYSEEILRQCAEENKNGADWRLIWVNGLSLRQQEQVCGRNRKKQPCFDPDYTWWMGKEQDPWATQPISPSYRLLDFKGRFANTNWQRQEEEIGKLGNGFRRAEEQAVSEACLTIYMVGGKKERLLRNWYHWGCLLSAAGGCVLVGLFRELGFRVSLCWPGYSDSSLRVVLSRKSD